MNERKRRIGENEAIFRSVNEKVSKLNVTFTAATNTMRIVCEGGVRSSPVHIEITPETYRRVRDARMITLAERGAIYRAPDAGDCRLCPSQRTSSRTRSIRAVWSR